MAKHRPLAYFYHSVLAKHFLPEVSMMLAEPKHASSAKQYTGDLYYEKGYCFSLAYRFIASDIFLASTTDPPCELITT